MNLEEITQTILQIYEKNLLFLKNYNHSLYKQVKDFEKKGIENWFIDFIDGRFELINQDNKSIYNCDPFYDATYRANNIKQSPYFSLINTTPITKGMTKYENSINSYEFINEILQSINVSEVETFKHSQKFIFFGTLLGVHINEIHSVCRLKSYLIVEPNLEIFRLSLFLCDYEVIAQSSRVFFAIGCNANEYQRIIRDFVDYEYVHNHFIHFELASTNEAFLIEETNLALLSASELTYPFSEFLLSWRRTINCMKDKNRHVVKLAHQLHILQDKPILFLGAGPSLSKFIEWIYLYQDYFTIVAASASLKKLELLGIIPDIIMIMDGQKEQVLRQLEIRDAIYKDTVALLSTKIDNDVYQKFDSTKTFLLQDSLEVIHECGTITGVTVGDTGLEVLRRLGGNQIYLLGFDAALDSKTGKTHSGVHHSSKTINLEISKSSRIDYDKHLIWVEGNFEEKVPTLMLYYNMIEVMNEVISKFDDKTAIFNLSHGAKFDGAQPCKIEKINYQQYNKDAINKQIFTHLKQLSKSSFSKIDLQDLYHEKLLIAQLQKLNNSDEIYEEFLNIFHQNPTSLVLQIIEKYFKLTRPYYVLSRNSSLQFKHFQIILDQMMADLISL